MYLPKSIKHASKFYAYASKFYKKKGKKIRRVAYGSLCVQGKLIIKCHKSEMKLGIYLNIFS